jgi:hypothetical protein
MSNTIDDAMRISPILLTQLKQTDRVPEGILADQANESINAM